MAIGKEFQDRLGVVADGRQLQALLFESRNGALQLDQLPLAEGSPVGGAEEKENDAAAPFQGVERLGFAELVGSGESRRLAA